MKESAEKEKIINRLIKRGVVDEGDNTRKFLKDLRKVTLCAPLVKLDRETKKFSLRQLCVRYNLTIMQVRNILKK